MSSIGGSVEASISEASPSAFTQWKTVIATASVLLCYYVILIFTTGHGGLLRHPAVRWAGVGCVMVAIGLGPAWGEYGTAFFLPQSAKVLSLSSREWAKILPRKTIVVIGGHHRAGTTLLWSLMQQHPAIGGFGAQRITGSDYSEGVFLSNGVLPTFGVGRERLAQKPAESIHNDTESLFGAGTYALANRTLVHWTDKSKASLVTQARQTSLMNAWGYQWDKAGSASRPLCAIPLARARCCVSCRVNCLPFESDTPVRVWPTRKCVVGWRRVRPMPSPRGI